MSTPSDPYANPQSALSRHRLDFIKTELKLCLTFSISAARKYETGNQESAKQSMASAESAYETVIHMLSDPKHSKHLTVEEIEETKAELERLRGRLDGLQRFRK